MFLLHDIILLVRLIGWSDFGGKGDDEMVQLN